MSIMIKVSAGAGGGTVELDPGSLPPSTRDFLLAYGATQYANDGHASLTSEVVPNAAERIRRKREALDARVAQMKAGTCGQRSPVAVTPEVIARQYGVSVEAITAFLQGQKKKSA